MDSDKNDNDKNDNDIKSIKSRKPRAKKQDTTKQDTTKQDKVKKKANKISRENTVITKYGKKGCSNPIFLDNNGTTLISPQAEKIYTEWLRCYNASSDSHIAKAAKQVIERAADDILAHCGTSTANHTALFTSCGTESNCFIIRACVKSYRRKLMEKGLQVLPHIISSAVEHHSILECLKDLEESKQVEVSLVSPTIYGNILAEDVEPMIKFNTCLITIMYANNEIPIINNIKEIGAVAHKHKIPIHSDCVQIFGKFKINLQDNNIDAISASAHKFYGPKGMGVLVISNDLIEGYKLTAEISGSQQHGLRGGTENVAGIASMLVAMKTAFINRKEKNDKLAMLRDRTLDKLEKYFTVCSIDKYIGYNDNDNNDKVNDKVNICKQDLEIVILGPPRDKKGFILPNTVLLSICKNRGKPFCNVDLKHYLDTKKIIVGIGSTCMTSSDKASHVLYAIGAPPVVRRGVLRVSFGDNNKVSDVDTFISVLKDGIIKQCSDL